MKRNIISIDESKCNGCGLCISACHEGALQLIDGKARLVSESYCDGLGNCLPQCPTGAIQIEERDAAPFDESAVLAHGGKLVAEPVSELAQWPCQIKLVPVNAPYFKGARLLVAADCAAFARATFHQDFMRGKITLVGCPKLDGVDYAEKLGAILRANDIRSVTVVRMEVPCCGGLEHAVRGALVSSGKMIPWQVVTLATDGTILEG